MKLIKFVPMLLCFAALGVNAAGKFGFINPAVVLEKSPQAIAAAKEMKKEFSQREIDLRAAAASIQEMEKTYQTDGAIMSAGQQKKMEEEIIQKKRKFQFDQQSMQQDLQKRRNQILQQLQINISKVIREYGDKNGYDFIFTEGVAYANDSVNITDEILRELAK